MVFQEYAKFSRLDRWSFFAGGYFMVLRVLRRITASSQRLRAVFVIQQSRLLSALILQ